MDRVRASQLAPATIGDVTMIDLNSPNPLLMTPYELIGFLAGVAAVVILAARDFWRFRSRRRGERPIR
jgi:hypothetical protein